MTKNCGILGLAATLLLLTNGASFATDATNEHAASPLLNRALAGPMKHVEEIIFVLRLPYDDPHWYANIGYYCDDETQKAFAGNGQPGKGKLCKLNVRTGKVGILVDANGGSIRDPQVDYDGQKVLFSYRKANSDYYNLYEVNTDGTGLRQITSGPFDDYEPTYTPDGGIVFVSTRCRCWVNCWMTQVGVLYRCDADGGNIQRLSYSGEHDNTPWVMPDGRILYTRWEYVDRSQVEFHHLWTMNPDGTAQTILYGNMHPGIVMIDAKPIPGTDDIIASFSPRHGATGHKGIATIVSPRGGPDDVTSAHPLHKAKWSQMIRDPYPISADCFLVARGKQLLVMDSAGNAEEIYALRDDGEVHEPRVVAARKREPVIPHRTHQEAASGQFILTDIYRGRNLQGVERGSIKRLLVLEVLPKQVNFSGGQDLVSWLGTFTLERVLGTVPVESDGSAFFEVPAGRAVFFVALDENDMSVKRMHSFTSVLPGEVTGCVGCHESRTKTPNPAPISNLMALRRPASRIQSFAGLSDVLDFPRDIQPVLDRHCVRCHNHTRRDGNVILTGDLAAHWSHSFFSLFAHRQVADGRNGLGDRPPRSVGSSASPFLEKLDPSHYGVDVTQHEWRTVWLWIESGAPFAGSYAGLRNKEAQTIATEATARVFVEGAKVLKRRCAACHAVGDPTNEQGKALPFHPEVRMNSRGLERPTGIYERVVLKDDPLARFSTNILLNFTQPSLSPLLLGPLARDAGGWGSCGTVFSDRSDADYLRLLSTIERGKAELEATPRYGTPGFQPNRQYVREMKRYGVLSPGFDLSKDKLDFFQADQDYWRSLWYSASSSEPAAE